MPSASYEKSEATAAIIAELSADELREALDVFRAAAALARATSTKIVGALRVCMACGSAERNGETWAERADWLEGHCGALERELLTRADGATAWGEAGRPPLFTGDEAARVVDDLWHEVKAAGAPQAVKDFAMEAFRRLRQTAPPFPRTRAVVSGYLAERLADPGLSPDVRARMEFLGGSDADAVVSRVIDRYQKCALALWSLFPRDPLPPDDPAHAWVERLESLVRRKLIVASPGVVGSPIPSEAEIAELGAVMRALDRNIAADLAGRVLSTQRASYYLPRPDRPGLWWARRSGAERDGGLELGGWGLVEVRQSRTAPRQSATAPQSWQGRRVSPGSRGWVPVADFRADQWTPVAPPAPVAVDCDCSRGDAAEPTPEPR